MFQSFTGSSRRPRQVNLSGQNLDPFAASSWAPSASGTQKTVANAQQERLQRQQERERLNATKTVQRVWRGHKNRRETASQFRKDWDDLDSNLSGITPQQQLLQLPEELRLLLAFFSPHHAHDIDRLYRFSGRLLEDGWHQKPPWGVLRPQLPRLVDILLTSLSR